MEEEGGGHFVLWGSSSGKGKLGASGGIQILSPSVLNFVTEWSVQKDESKLVLKRQCKLNHLIIRVLTNFWKTH